MGLRDRLRQAFGRGGPPADTPTELIIEDVSLGDGEEAVQGSTVGVHYTGWLVNGAKFDSSRDRGVPFFFQIGGGQVIAGWEQGVAGMRIGGKRKLTIPPHLGYGRRGAGPIPANSTLIFDIELLKIR